MTLDDGNHKRLDRKEMSFSNRLADRLGDSYGCQSNSRLSKTRDNETTLKGRSKRKSW